MSLQPKTDTFPACLGIACPKHSRCTRWHAVEGSQADPSTIDTCLDSEEAFPEFVEVPAQTGAV